MPQIAQQDYIYIEVPTLDDGEESSLSNEIIRALYRAAKSRTILEVILVLKSPADNGTRILSYTYTAKTNFLSINFYSRGEDAIISWTFNQEPAPEEPTEEPS